MLDEHSSNHDDLISVMIFCFLPSLFTVLDDVSGAVPGPSPGLTHTGW